MMTLTERLLTIGVVVLGTMMTRFLPFLVFPAERATPKYIRYLGQVLPAAAIGLLVVYCMKDWNLLAKHHAIPELIATAITALLHIWKRRMLISIAGGTIIYMLLVQFIFL